MLATSVCFRWHSFLQCKRMCPIGLAQAIVLTHCLTVWSSCTSFFFIIIIIHCWFHACELIPFSLLWCMLSNSVFVHCHILEKRFTRLISPYSQLLACALPAALPVICVNCVAYARVQVHGRYFSCIYCSILSAELLHVMEGWSFLKCVAWFRFIKFKSCKIIKMNKIKVWLFTVAVLLN